MTMEAHAATGAGPLRLSSCELAYALARGLAEDEALALTHMHFGAEPAEARIMLAAGSSGLRAHGLSAQAATGEIRLIPLLDEIVTRMTTTTHLVQCHRSTTDTTQVLALHCAPRGLVRHVQPEADVHELEAVQPAAALQRAADFFAVPDAPAQELSPVLLRHTVVEAVRDNQDRGDIERRLIAAAVPPPAAALLAEDLANSRYRGSVVRIEARPDGESHVENRLFVLSGPARVWLLAVVADGDGGVTQFSPASRGTLGDILSPVLHDAPPQPPIPTPSTRREGEPWEREPHPSQ